MKFFTKKNVVQKIVIAIVFIILFNFCIPSRSYAWDPLGDLAREFIQFIASIGDLFMGAFNKFMLGANFDTAMLDADDENLKLGSGSWLTEGISEGTQAGTELDASEIDNGWLGMSQAAIPNMLYSPETIFSNRIAALDINFLNPNEFSSVIGTAGDDKESENANNMSKSAAGALSETISIWYRSFRNLSVVVLLTVLVYIGIRIIISSTAGEKAKYKENLKDWVVALCLVFFIHILMSGILMLTDKFSEVLDTSSDDAMAIRVTGGIGGTKNAGEDFIFRTNLVGFSRFMTQQGEASWVEVGVYTIIYIVLIIYTGIFTILYLKRFLWVAFLTMIAPLVAITYPIDRAGDGKAQAFNMWFREYTMNVIIQPVHLLLYTALIGSSLKLIETNMIYALVALGFLIPAEKFIKEMFGLNKAQTQGDFGSFAGGALTMSALSNISNRLKGGSKGGSSSGGGTGNGNNPGKGTPHRVNFRGGNNGNTAIGAGETSSGTVKDNGESDNGVNSGGSTNTSTIPSEENSNDDALNIPNSNGLNSGKEDNDQLSSDEALDSADSGNLNLSSSENQNLNPNARRLNPRDGRPKKIKGFWGTVGGLAKKNGGKMIGKAAKKTFKAASIATLGAAGATVGLAGAIATGDPKNLWKGVAAGAGAGAGAGMLVGGLPDKAISSANTMRNWARDKEYQWNREMYGEAYALDKRNEALNKKAFKEYKKDPEQLRRAQELAAKIEQKTGRNITTEDVLKSNFDYEKYGIDSTMADKLTQMEAIKSNEEGRDLDINSDTHTNMIQQGLLASDINDQYFKDDKMNNALREQVKEEYGIQDETAVDKKMQEIASLKGDALGQREKIRQQQKKEEEAKNDLEREKQRKQRRQRTRSAGVNGSSGGNYRKKGKKNNNNRRTRRI